MIMAGTSSVSQRQPMESLPCVTSISSVRYRGSCGAAMRRIGSPSATVPRGSDENARRSAPSTRSRLALPQ